MIKRVFSFFNADGLLKDSSVMFLGMAVAHVCNLLFQFFMGRRLSADEFALLISMLGVFNVLTLPLGVAATAVNRYSGLLMKENRMGDIYRLVVYWGWRLGVLGLICSAFCFIYPQSIAGFLHLDRVDPIYIFGIIITGIFIRPVVNGALIGVQRFDGWCIGMVLGAAMRVLSGALLVVYISSFAGWGLLAHGIGFYVTIGIGGIVLLYALKGKPRSSSPLPSMQRYVFISFFILFGYSLLMTGDVVLVKHLYPESAGDFSYGATLGRLVIFVPQALSTTMFPKVISEQGASRSQFHLYLKTLFMVLFAAVAVALAFYFLIPYFLRIIYGIESPSREMLLGGRWVAWIMVPVALLSVSMRFALAQQRFKIASVVPLAALVYLVICFSGPRGVEHMLCTSLICSFVAGAVMILGLFRSTGDAQCV